MSGFIYIMSNPSFSDGRIKIGKSKSDPSAFRKEELYSTGVPEPFEIEYFAFVEDYDRIEVLIHKKLDDYRPNKKREFFTCSIPSAILCIQQISSIKFEEILYKSPQELEEERQKNEAKKLDEQKRERLEQKKIDAKISAEKRRLEIIKKREDYVTHEWSTNKKFQWRQIENYTCFSVVVGITTGAVNIFDERGFELLGFLFGALPTFLLFRQLEKKTKVGLYSKAKEKFPNSIVDSIPRQNSSHNHITKTAEHIDSRIKNRPIGYQSEVVIVCDNCGIKNKIPKEKLEKKHVFKPICAVCKAELKLDS